MVSKDKTLWFKAMQTEIDSLKENDTWDLVKKPDAKNVIPG